MTVSSSKVQFNFNKASSSYDYVAHAQKKAASFLVDKLLATQSVHPKTILDLGTGTGYVVELLLQNYPYSSYILNDIAEQMLATCRLKFSHYPNFTFCNNDMETADIPQCDLIISNLALQWISNLPNMLEKCYTCATHSFAFSTLLDGTFKEWDAIINEYIDITPRAYPTASQLEKYCRSIKGASSFSCWTMDIPLKFATSLSFVSYLKKLGASSTENIVPISKLRAMIREQNDPIITSYRIFFGIFNKEEK